jgi:hypothetical protein
MTLAIPAGVPATSRWLYYAIFYGNIDGCQLGVDGTQLATAETFAGRNYYYQDALGQARAPFSPDGRNSSGVLQASVTPCTQAEWNTEVNDPMNGTGFSHPVDTFPNVLGIRGADPTWPGHDAINAWTPGDLSFVDKSVTAWSVLMKSVPRLTVVRLWHEHGNGSYGPDDPTYTDALFKSNWRKVVDRWRVLGAVGDDVTTAKCMIAWCPAGHAGSPGDDFGTFPGTPWVHVIGRDNYYHGSADSPPSTWADVGQAWYDRFHPVTGPGNPDHRPLIIFESGVKTTVPGAERTAALIELGQRLTGGT